MYLTHSLIIHPFIHPSIHLVTKSLPVEVLDEPLVVSGQEVVEGPLMHAVQTDQVGGGKRLQCKQDTYRQCHPEWSRHFEVSQSVTPARLQA